MEYEYRSESPEQTQRIGAALGGVVRPGDSVLLRGELGSGKSVLARSIAKRLGVTDIMPSPTFTLMQPYRGNCPVYHFDLYRLEDEEEFYAAGLDEYVEGDGVALIEWPIPGMAVLPRIEIDFARGDLDDVRIIQIEATGFEERERALREALSAWEVKA